MSERASIFGDTDFNVAGFAPQKPKETPAPEKVRKVSEGAEFVSREPQQKRGRREQRRYRTGRDAQFNIKADPKVIDVFYSISDTQEWVLGYTLERAVAALQKELAAEKGRAGSK
jgi:hypothetical protein